MARNVMFVEIHKIHLRSGRFMVSANKADGRFHSFEWAWDKAVSPWSQETGSSVLTQVTEGWYGSHPSWSVWSLGSWVQDMLWSGQNVVMWEAQGATNYWKGLRGRSSADPWLRGVVASVRDVLAPVTNRPPGCPVVQIQSMFICHSCDHSRGWFLVGGWLPFTWWFGAPGSFPLGISVAQATEKESREEAHLFLAFFNFFPQSQMWSHDQPSLCISENPARGPH